MLNSINLYALRNDEFIQVFRDITDLISRFDVSKLQIEKEAHAMKQMLKDLDDIFGAYARGSEHSKFLAEIDAARDRAIMSIKATVSAMTNHYDRKKSDAAELILNQINKYGANIARLNYQAETTVIKNLMDDFNDNADLKKALALLGLTDWVEHLNQKNSEFRKNYHNRVDKLSRGKDDAVKNVRPEAKEVLRQFEAKVAATHLVLGTPDHEQLIKKMNVLADEYNNIRKRRKSKEDVDNNGQPKSATDVAANDIQPAQ